MCGLFFHTHAHSHTCWTMITSPFWRFPRPDSWSNNKQNKKRKEKKKKGAVLASADKKCRAERAQLGGGRSQTHSARPPVHPAVDLGYAAHEEYPVSSCLATPWWLLPAALLGQPERDSQQRAERNAASTLRRPLLLPLLTHRREERTGLARVKRVALGSAVAQPAIVDAAKRWRDAEERDCESQAERARRARPRSLTPSDPTWPDPPACAASANGKRAVNRRRAR